MPFNTDDTIAAVASPPGAAARGIIRVSGAAAVGLVSRLVDAPLPDHGPPRRVSTLLTAQALGSRLPTDVLVWPSSRSYTGQPMVEMHLLGAPPLLDLLMSAVMEAGARPAERGEFTMRAFLHGRIDLLQAEAVTGVIDAADHEELQAALTQLGGGLTRQLRGIRESIIAILGDLEAGLDFVEEDIEFISADEIIRRLTEGRDVLRRLLSDAQDRLPSGYRPRVVLAGLPNAGKSTLFNRLAESELAIASTIAGTTRDYLSCAVTTDSMTFELIDTAGWDESPDGIMQAARQLRHQQLSSADLVVWCTAADLPAEDRVINGRLLAEARQQARQTVPLMTCADRVIPMTRGGDGVAVSAVSGEGLDALKTMIVEQLRAARTSHQELLATTSVRCRDSLQRTLRCIESSMDSASRQLGDEITAISLRESLTELRAMLGETWTDDILDHIFSSFCIGK